jgi:isocitrate lyase
MVTQMAKYLDTVYVSGWQCSSTASSTDEPGPDLADYPMVQTQHPSDSQPH